jgi:NADH:ubiquinone oxidoreductase subunit H
VLTIGLSIGVAIVIYLTVYREVAWLIGLALAYAVLLWRARRVHADYLDRRGS